MPVNKVRRNGSYAPLSAHYYKDEALLAAGEKAEVLFTRSLAFCADVLNDGFIAERQLPLFTIGLGTLKSRVAKLLEGCAGNGCDPETCAGLWHRDAKRGGYVVTGWLRWNRSREEINELADKDADRKNPAERSPWRDRRRPPGRGSQHGDENPDGNQSGSQPESGPPPNGVQPSRAHSTPRHTTTHHDTPGSDRTPSGPVRSEPPPGARQRSAQGASAPPGETPNAIAAKSPPDLTPLKKQLRAAVRKAHTNTGRRPGAFEELRAATSAEHSKENE